MALIASFWDVLEHKERCNQWGDDESVSRCCIFWFQAVLVDMEEGVVSEMMKGPLREVFDFQQLITDVSGCGNNW